MQKVRLAEDAWNTRDPAKVALAYAIDSRWRNRSEFINGRNEIIAFLSRKWSKELDYRLIKEMWAFTGNRIAVRFAYEWHDDSDHWYRSYGNVPVQREMESGRSPLVSIPPFGRGFSRHRGLPIRSGFLRSAEAEPPRSGHRLDEPARLSLGTVASLQSLLPFRLAPSL